MIALSITPGIGGKSIARIAMRNELTATSPDEFCRLSPEALREDYGLTVAVADRWSTGHKKFLTLASQMLDQMQQLNIGFATPVDAHYPAELEEFDSNPPGLLFLYGNQHLLTTDRFAVLSSRGASPAALDAIEKRAEAGVLQRRVLVSGHDKLEYQRSAIVPLRWGAPRILVLDQGFFSALGEDLSDEPFRAARLWRYEFDPKTDLVISTVGPFQASHTAANRERDKVIAGLSKVLDFIQVNEGGNMEKLLRQALKVGRTVRVWDQCATFRRYVEQGAEPFNG